MKTAFANAPVTELISCFNSAGMFSGSNALEEAVVICTLFAGVLSLVDGRGRDIASDSL
jgi:hypothetical protein